MHDSPSPWIIDPAAAAAACLCWDTQQIWLQARGSLAVVCIYLVFSFFLPLLKLAWLYAQEEVQSKDSEKEAPRSEADSEEAIQDVVAVSQEGSLGSLSDSDAGFSPLANRHGLITPPVSVCCVIRTRPALASKRLANIVCWKP